MVSTHKRLVIVLGMHRSGTSTLTRALNVLGVELGERLMPPTDGNNAKGFFEDIDLNALNIELLHALNSDWHCLAPIDSTDVVNLHKKGYFLKAVEVLRRKTAEAAIFGFKDPRVAKLLPFWREVIDYCGFDASYVIAIRHPISVAQSLAKRDGFSPEKSYMLWLGHVLTSLAYTENQPRVLIDYDHFLQSPRQDLRLIAKRLGLALDAKGLQHYQAEFLDTSLRHSVYSITDLSLDTTCPLLVQEVYVALIEVFHHKQLDSPSFLAQTAVWVKEFERLKATMRWTDHLLAHIEQLNHAVAVSESAIPELITSALAQDSNVFQNVFDEKWYLSAYPDVAASGDDPYQHYIVNGLREGRLPAQDRAGFVRDALVVKAKALDEQVVAAHAMALAHKQELLERERAYTQQLQQVQQDYDVQRSVQSREYAVREHTQQTIAQQQKEAYLIELAEREKSHHQQLLQIQQDYIQQKNALQQEFGVREQAHLAQLHSAKQEIAAHLTELAGREQAFSTRLQQTQQQYEQQREQQREQQAREFSVREQAQLRQLALGQEQAQAYLLAQIDREKAYAAQQQAMQLSHEQQKREQHDNHAVREQVLTAQLTAKQEDLQRFMQTWAAAETNQQLALTALQQELAALRRHHARHWLVRLWLWLAMRFSKHPSVPATATALVDNELVLPTAETPIPPSLNNTQNRIGDMTLSPIDTVASTLEELLSYYDEHFIYNAYQILLGRAPDPEGLRHYLGKIRSGVSKAEILANIRYSREGKSRKVTMVGLNKLIKRNRRLKLPVLGALLRVAARENEDQALRQNVRAIDNKLYVLDLKMHAQYAKVNASLAELVGSLNSKVLSENISPLADMAGPLEKLQHLLDSKAAAKLWAETEDSPPHFDEKWYLEQNPDVAKSGLDPYEHYLTHGKAEGRHPAFDGYWYLSQYPEVAKSGLTPYEHYRRYGKKQGLHPAFDADWYLSQYPDVAKSGLEPRVHYLLHGKAMGLHPAFDRAWYLHRYPDVAASGMDALKHYLQSGKAEGRYPAYSPLNPDGNNYPKWVADYDTLTGPMRTAMQNQCKRFVATPLISVVMPVYNPNPVWLAEAIESVIRQIYPYWELCIADDLSPDPAIRPILERYARQDARIKVVFRSQNGHISKATNSALEIAQGEWIALLDHDDMLSEHALFWVVDTINRHPDTRMMYSDEDKMNEQGDRFGPYFKCDWNPDLFYSHNMFSHLGVYHAELVRQVGGFRVGFEGSQDYDLALRCIEQVNAKQIYHIPRVLYHWRVHAESTASSAEAKPYAMIAGERAINDHFKRLGIDAKAELIAYGYRVRYALPKQLPLVSLIIPTRNGAELIRQCIESIVQKTTYPNYEILIVDNGSDEPAALRYLNAVVADPRIRVMRDDRPFNFSAMNNAAVKKVRGDIIGLINDDIEVISPDWLTEMVGHALRPEVGAVGAKLLYPNDTIQHAGVLLGVTGIAGHAHKNLPRFDHGYFSRANLIQSFSAVTAACLLIRKATYESLGGLNEADLTVAFNDIDFCIRVRDAGYRNMWTPYAELYHYESATRGYEDSPEKKARFEREIDYMRLQWGDALANDPAYSPNLTCNSEDFSLAWPPRVEKLG